ncbi:flagellar hook-length control protein FliK [Dechloromonas sp. ARDL1]|uniref:flagellar hook-length control protein FliK n=1 Tax=Dechloromonas sp. ARDL1 TaxID=3322121 RepID=UPI003DA6F13C
MGLSVISQLATVASANPATAAGAANSAPPGDFAALLSGQSLTALIAGSDTTLTLKIAADDTSKQDSLTGDATADAGVSVLDPAALIAMLGSTQTQPTIRSDVSNGALNDEALANGSGTPWVGGSEPKLRDMPASDKMLSSQNKLQGVLNTTEQLTNDSAPASKAALDTANIAAAGQQAASSLPAFSEAIAASLHQRGVAPGTQPHASSIPAPLHSQAWSQQFSEKVVWMANQEVQSAQININPPQLGPVQITLNLSGDQATAIFASPHADVRQAIENSLPQLKEMLASAGISLGDANVGANLAQQNQNSPLPTPNRTQATLENAILPANDNAPGAGVATPLQQGRGLVDLFA